MTEFNAVMEMRERETKRAAAVGAGFNLVLAIGKTAIGILAQSQSLVADGLHSLSDLFSDALVYVAAHHARQEPDSEHPYGHGRFETVATMGLGGILILVALGIIWDAFARMFAPETLLTPSKLALFAAAFSVFANEWLYRYTYEVGRRIRSDLLLANAWHHRSDAVSSVVVMVGVGGTLAGLPYLDAVAAVAVGVMIVKIGWELGWGAIQELVDASLDEERVKAIEQTILSVGGVRDLHMLRTRRLGGHASADVHVQVEPRLSVSEGHMVSLVVEQRLKEEIDVLEDVTVHVDPEDDQDVALCKDLPLRAEVLEKLNQAWSGIEGAEARERVMLHYLSGKLEVDVFFPRHVLPTAAEAEDMEARLQGGLEAGLEEASVRVFAG